MIKLCYKEYNFKINLAACKLFYDQTGADLQYTLLTYLDSAQKTQGQDLIERLASFHNVCSFDVATKLIHCLIKQEHPEVPLAEIENACFMVSWTPNEQDSDLCQPWPLVCIDIATQVNQYFADNAPKKPQAQDM